MSHGENGTKNGTIIQIANLIQRKRSDFMFFSDSMTRGLSYTRGPSSTDTIWYNQTVGGPRNNGVKPSVNK